MGEPLGRQRDHQVIHPRQPALPLADQLRAEAAVPVPGHVDLHRAGLGEHRLSAHAVAGVAAVAAGRVVLAVAEMIIHLALHRGLDDPLRQPSQQPTLAGQLQALRPRPVRELLHQLLINRVGHINRSPADRHLSFHISHRCLLRLRSYTVEGTVPPGEVPDAA